MKYCVHCGKEVSDGAIVCPNCGCSVSYDQGRTAANTYQTTPQPVQDSYSTMSIIGLVFAILGSIIGLIISIIAFNESKNTGSQKSRNMSKAGIIIASVELGLGVLGGIIGIIFYIVIFAGIMSSIPTDPSYPGYVMQLFCL